MKWASENMRCAESKLEEGEEEEEEDWETWDWNGTNHGAFLNDDIEALVVERQVQHVGFRSYHTWPSA